MNLSGIYEILKINYSYLFQSFPSDFMDIWSVSPDILVKMTLTEHQKELLADYTIISVKQDYYKALSELFLFFDVNGVFKERVAADYELIFEERFKNYAKGPKFIGYDEFLINKDAVKSQDSNEFLHKIKTQFLSLNKIIKSSKDTGQLTNDQITYLDAYYKNVVKNSLVFLKLLKTDKYSQFKARISFDIIYGAELSLD